MKNLSSVFSNLDYRQRVMYPLWVVGLLGLIIFFALYLAIDSVFSEAVKASTASKEQLTGISDAVFNTLLYMFFAFIGGFVAIAAFGKQLANGPAGLLRKTEDVLKKVSAGVFSDRIVDITQKDELGRIAWLVNDSVDQIEALLKELTTSIEYSSQGKFFRKPRLEGTKGMMRFTSEKVAQAIERQEKLTSSLRGERQQYEEMNTKIIDALSEITAGNLTVQIHGANDENSRAIYEKFNRLVHQFAEIVNSLNHQGEQWNRIAEVIASNSEAISSRALQQKTQSEEIEMAVGDMAKTIFDISKNTSAAHSTAQQSGRLAEDGGKVIKQALSTMDIIGEIVTDTVNIVDSLGKSSNEIGIITQVIGDIAEQTNLLALNAAIEAARAGEQGRGFAVVADEVRKLAERTAASTKQIDKVVADITRGSEAAIEAFKKNSQKVAEGKNVAAHAESSLSEIISGSLKVSDMINQVSAASEELAATAEQVNKNIENITAFIRQNTDDMNNIAESTESLNAVVAESKSLSNKFNTSNNNDSLMLSGNTIAANIDAAIKAHKLWKVKITKMVNGQDSVADSSVVSHKECQLGKLYYNEWAQIFSGNSLYHELGAVHQEMHNLLKQTVQAYNKGNRHEARSNAEKVYQLSDEVVTYLQRLKSSY